MIYIWQRVIKPLTHRFIFSKKKFGGQSLQIVKCKRQISTKHSNIIYQYDANVAGNSNIIFK